MSSFTLPPIILSSLVSLSLPAPQVQEAQIGVYEISAVSGLWQLEARDGTLMCDEYYHLGVDGHIKTVSGDEITYGRYAYVPQDEGLAILAIETTYDNNALDCSGKQIDQSGDTFATFVQLDSRHNPTRMQWCGDNQGEQCSVALKKVLP